MAWQTFAGLASLSLLMYCLPAGINLQVLGKPCCRKHLCRSVLGKPQLADAGKGLQNTLASCHCMLMLPQTILLAAHVSVARISYPITSLRGSLHRGIAHSATPLTLHL